MGRLGDHLPRGDVRNIDPLDQLARSPGWHDERCVQVPASVCLRRMGQQSGGDLIGAIPHRIHPEGASVVAEDDGRAAGWCGPLETLWLLLVPLTLEE